MLLWLPFFAVLLAACATEPEVVERPKVVNLPAVPVEFRSCPGLPPRPAGTLQSDAARYILQLEAALLECSSDLKGLNAYINTLRAELNS